MAAVALEPQTLSKHICADLRDMGHWTRAVPEMFRGLIAMHREGGETVVKTLPEVAAAFNMAPQSVKGDWRDGGMPGRPGRWDLAEILCWRIERDGRARGATVDTTPVESLVDKALELLSEQYGITHVIAGGERLAQAWADTLAEAEAGEKKRAPSARKRITN